MMVRMPTPLDHLVLAGSDHSALVAWWTKTAGVAPEPGGAHAGFGTRNSLVGLGGSTYLELIGCDPDQGEPTTPRPFGIDGLEPDEFKLATLALAVDDIESACSAVRGCGIEPGDIRKMGRRRADGIHLQWRLAIPTDPNLGGVLPFLIEWGKGTPHPAGSLGGSVRMQELRLAHPSPGLIAKALDALGSSLEVFEEESASISVRLDTPAGEVSV